MAEAQDAASVDGLTEMYLNSMRLSATEHAADPGFGHECDYNMR